MAEKSAAAGPRPLLSSLDVVALVVGIVVGAGIFRTPGVVARGAGSETAALVAWVLGGVVSLIGALCYVELATAYPHAGGEYRYLRRAFGRLAGFLFVWARLTVIQSGSVALLAFLIADYIARVLPFGPPARHLYAALPVIALTATNLAGLHVGRRLQGALAGCLVLGLLTVVGNGLWAEPAAAVGAPPAAEGGGFALAMVFVLLTYGGWNEASYVSAEMRRGAVALRRALLGGVSLVSLLYVLVNVALFHGLGFAGVAASEAVAADVAQRAMGEAGAAVVSALVVLAAVSTMNATIITGARSGYAVGRDFERLSFLGRWRGDAGTPTAALIAQGALALALVAIGSLTRRGFETMVELTAPVFWLFFLLVGISLPVLRRREPHVPRPFPVPLYPLTPLLFCASAAYMLFASIAHTGMGSLVGLAVLALGLPAFLAVRRRAPPPAPDEEAKTTRTRILARSMAAAALLSAALLATLLNASGEAPRTVAVEVPDASASVAPLDRPADVPYVPTPEAVVARMIEMAEVRKGDLVYDLGCGDGRIVIAAVQTPGVRGVCVDIDPVRVQESKLNARKAGVEDRIRFVQGDLFDVPLSGATVVTLYLMPDVNLRLRPRLQALPPGTRIVSHAFSMGDWPPEEEAFESGSMIYRWTVRPPRAR
ncbi:MAG TPA: amino acid permease [Vicinamibacteria bacterium]|nr:amino acid permease [Vicinamibacteria bacterium]